MVAWGHDRRRSTADRWQGACRLANLVNKGGVIEVIVMPKVLEAMAHVLGPRFKLSSLNVRSPDPHSPCDQPLHAYYARWDKPQQQWRKKLLSAELQSRLSPDVCRILPLDDYFNDELCATGSGVSGFRK
jgi:hypothetical protein